MNQIMSRFINNGFQNKPTIDSMVAKMGNNMVINEYIGNNEHSSRFDRSSSCISSCRSSIQIQFIRFRPKKVDS